MLGHRAVSRTYNIKRPVWNMKLFRKRQLPQLHRHWRICGWTAGASVNRTVKLSGQKSTWPVVKDETLIVTDLSSVHSRCAHFQHHPPSLTRIFHPHSPLIVWLIDWLSGWLMAPVLISNISKVTHWCNTQKLPNQHFSVNSASRRGVCSSIILIVTGTAPLSLTVDPVQTIY